MKEFEKFKRNFSVPDRRYAVYQIIHGGISDKSRADYYEKRHFGGVVGNVSYSRGFPEDEQRWQAAADGVREYIRRGMHVWLYDENGYPSGTAGGYVTEKYPEHIAKGLYCYDYWRKISGPGTYRADVPGDKLWKALLVPVGEGEPVDVTHFLNENNVLYIDVPAGTYYLFMMSIRRLFDGTHATESYSEPRNYISLSDRAATEIFIKSTHENYRRLLGDEFGKGVLAMFTDEPSLISWNIRAAVFPILPWLDSYPEDFEKKYGYEFYKACVAVVLNMGNEKIKRRCDFWEFIADTVAYGYFGTIREWCRGAGLRSSGHMLEEERLQAHIYNYGSFYRSMKRFDWPGIDQLNTEPAALMSTKGIPIARFVASFADINGEHEAFTEFSDHCVRERGETAGAELYYASVNWHLAMGINNFTSYYSWQGFDDAGAAAFNDYTARCGYLLRLGSRDSRVALFYPEAAMWGSYTPSTYKRAFDYTKQAQAIVKAFRRSAWDLIHRQIDFDCIDCDLLLRGEIRDGQLCYRDRRYSAVVMPCARVLESAAAEKLKELHDAGVGIFFCGEMPSLCREDGEHAPIFDELADFAGDGICEFSATEDFGKLLDKKLPGACRSLSFISDDGAKYHPMLVSHRRTDEDGVCVVFAANMDTETFRGKVRVFGGFSDVCRADAHSGEMSVPEYRKGEGFTEIDTEIAPNEAALYLLK